MKYPKKTCYYLGAQLTDKSFGSSRPFESLWKLECFQLGRAQRGAWVGASGAAVDPYFDVASPVVILGDGLENSDALLAWQTIKRKLFGNNPAGP